MVLLRRFLGAVRALRRRDETERELAEELRAYLDVAIEQKIAAGSSRSAAEREARLDIGSLEAIKDVTREAGWEAHIRAVADDVRFAWRRLARNRWLTLTTATLIAMSIGLTCAAFNIVDAIAFRNLNAPHPERLVRISGLDANGRRVLAHSLFERLAQDRERANPFIAQSQLVIGTANTTTRQLFILWTEGDFFGVLGGVPERGRFFDPDTREPAAVISDWFWRSAFAGDPAIVGRTLRLGTTDVPIVGVADPAFHGVSRQANWDAILPVKALYQPVVGRPLSGLSGLEVAAQLPPGVSPGAYESYLNSMWPELLEATVQPGYTVETWRQVRGTRARVESLKHGLNYTLDAKPELQRAATLTLTLALLIVIAACITVALLAVARGMASRRQSALMLALGGTRGRIIRTYLSEAVLVSLLGCGLGLLLSAWLTDVGASFMPVTSDYDWAIRMTSSATLIALLVGAATALVGGLMPAVVMPGAAAHEAVRSSAGLTQPHMRLRTGLMVAQLGLAVLLVHYSLMFFRDVQTLTEVDPGFNVTHLAAYALTGTLPPQPLPEQYFADLTERLRAVPGVEAVGLAAGNSPFVSLTDSGRQPLQADNRRDADAVTICTFPGFFATLQLPWVQGTDLSWNAGPTVVISESLARTLFPGGDALSHRIQVSTFPGWKPQQPLQIVGVVRDMAYNGPRLGPRPMVFMPCTEQMERRPSTYVTQIFVRSNRSVEDLRSAIESAVNHGNAQVVYRARAVADDLRNATQQERMLAAIAITLGILIVLVTGVGLYAFANYLATLRSREFAIRSALGGSRIHISIALLREIAIVLAVGSALGIGMTVTSRQLLTSLITSVPLLHVRDLALGIVSVATVVGLATLMPTWRTLRLDLARTLRID